MRKKIIIIGGLIAVAIIGVLIYFNQRNQDAQVASQNQNTDNEQFISIPELGVRIDRLPGMEDVGYVVKSQSDAANKNMRYVGFTSTDVNSLVDRVGSEQDKKFCSSSQGFAFGTINAFPGTFPDGDERPLRPGTRVLGNQFVGYESPQDVCSSNKEITALISAKTQLVNQAFQTITAIDGSSLSEVQMGTIEGSLGYPSEKIPTNMVTCAEPVAGGTIYCQSNHFLDAKKYTNGEGYYLTVPAGKYKVYATLAENPRDPKAYRAYYSEFVTCGMKVSCTDHTPIVVTVPHKGALTKIDPIDWYNQK